MGYNIFYWLFDEGEERLGVDADPERQNDEGHKRGVFTEIQVRQMFIGRLCYRAEHNALVEPQQVRRTQDNAQRAPGGPRFADLKCALQNRKFPDEPVEQRHAQRTEADDEVDGCEIGHGRCKAAEIGDQARVTPLVEHAHDQEKGAGGDAVVDLLEHAAGQAVRRERKNSQRAEAKMADGTIGDQALHVFLHEANEGAVNDAD